jgi:hypothetical protein
MYILIFKAIVLMALGSTLGFRFGITPTTSLRSQLLPFVKTYDLEKINDVLAQLKNETQFPELGSSQAPANPPEQLPSRLLGRFAKMNRAVFGRDHVLRLVPADGNLAAIHEAGRNVGFPREILPAISKSNVLLDFTLAHAMAHYIYELYIHKNKMSPHENVSRGNDATVSKTSEAASAHAEVDAIAVAILLKLGADPKKIHTEILKDFTSTKKFVDEAVDIKINEFTTFSAIPDDLQPKVRDNYIRLLSFLISFPKRG